jgi:uncharacterized protein YbjQ (UPF0145 family)
MQGGGIGHPVTLGPVQVRLSGVVKAEEAPASVSAPTVDEARAALDRVAQVSGANGVVQVGSDYQRMAIASGLSTQALVVVQAWGTAVGHAEGTPD